MHAVSPASPSPPSLSSSILHIRSILHSPPRSSLSYLTLLNTLQSTNASLVTPILLALPHFSTRLHATPSPALRSLFRAVLSVDIPTLATSQPLSSAMAVCLVDMLSAEPSFVDSILRYLAAMLKSSHALLPLVSSVLAAFLRLHTRAPTIVTAVFRAQCPHPVRPVQEHVAYLSGLLALTRMCPALTALTCVVFERVAAIEALIGTSVFVDPQKQTLQSPSEDPEKRQPKLSTAAQKLDAVLELLFDHYQKQSQSIPAAQFPSLLLQTLDLYVRYIIPVDTSYIPYLLIHLCNLSSSPTRCMQTVLSRFWNAFVDTQHPRALRIRFLHHWIALVIRANAVTTPVATAQLKTLAAWMHTYLARQRAATSPTPDADLHFLFYHAAAALFMGLCRRSDVVDNGNDVLEQCRVYTIIESPLKPLCILQGLVVKDIAELCEVTYSPVLVPSRTAFGAVNKVYPVDRAKDMVLDKCKEVLKGPVRDLKCENEDEKKRSEERQKKDTCGGMDMDTA